MEYALRKALADIEQLKARQEAQERRIEEIAKKYDTSETSIKKRTTDKTDKKQ